jgi:amino acid adenylation domain-containing protein
MTNRTTPTMDGTQAHELLDRWNPRRSFDPGPCLHERFEAMAAARPESVALVFGNERMTYAELNRRANQLAHTLAARGVGPDSLVGLCAERSLDLVVGLLGILKAGGAYVPLDPSYPADRLRHMLEDSGIAVLVTQKGAAPDLQAAAVAKGAAVVRLDGELSSDMANPAHRTRSENLAYIIYTSGSTGKPKGAPISHGNVTRLFAATDAWFGFKDTDVWTLFHSYAFDFSVWELWGALLYGGRLVVVPYLVSRSPDAFYALLGSQGVTVLNQTPSAFRQLVQAEIDAPARQKLVLRTVIFGGEALELQGLRPWFERHGDEHPRLVNMYGITETCVHVTYRPISWKDVRDGQGSVIGEPLPDLQIYLLDEKQNLVPAGEPGEIYVGGAGLGRGYLNRPELTAERFPNLSLAGRPPERLYRSGDLARRLPNGDLEYLGRIDHQVKLRGFRVELGEIESVLAQDADVREVVVLARQDEPGDQRLVAYLSMRQRADADEGKVIERLRALARARLPEYMVPSAFVFLGALPLTENGKVDRRALPAPKSARGDRDRPFAAPRSATEIAIAEVWRQILRLDRVGADESFFDLGGTSLLAVRAAGELRRRLGVDVPVVKMFEHPVLQDLARVLEVTGKDRGSVAPRPRRRAETQGQAERDIAIIGMAGRFPGAPDVATLWRHLLDGVDSVTFFAPDELDPREREASTLPDYVRARGIVADADKFDAEFFAENARIADITDPQQRVLLELAWAALEDAGVVPERYDGLIGVYAGTGHNTYFSRNVLRAPERIEAVGELQTLLANDKDFVATRIAHKLNLRGPALSLHTACSTSLVATSVAVHGLRAYECDIALAGAVSVTVPQASGHIYQEGAMLSADGTTRTFDAKATGTVFSDGGGVVVLKRLADARADGDRIYAVIRGAATNNDGAGKASFMAPSVSGQAAVIAAAQEDAGVDPESISYVETHGTATPLGDPIEVEALTRAFRVRTAKNGFCSIGSVKSNLGHLTAGSGVTGLIKTALSLSSRTLVPSIHFESPNPNIDFTSSPFRVQTTRAAWTRADASTPLRAGVSSFGVGGTNAHVVLEEAPAAPAAGPQRGCHLLTLSAKSEGALEEATRRLAAWLGDNPQANLADVAYTLQERRAAFPRRRFLVAKDIADAAASLAKLPPTRSGTRMAEARAPEVAFLFPGQGSQYVNMGRGLYDSEPVVRQAIDACAEILREPLGEDLRGVLFAEPGAEAEAQAKLQQTRYTQPALFTLEYALAMWWQSLGVRPAGMLGHSVGEFVAAHLAGVFSLEDGLRLVAERAALMQSMPPGSMLAVRAPAAQIEARLPEGLALAASNGPALCVVAGPHDAVAAFAKILEGERIPSRALQTSHAFHSPMMEPVVEPLAAVARKLSLSPPQIPFVSSVSGDWITAEQATSPDYWARHLRVPVRFAEGLQTLWTDPTRVLLEAGPRATNTTMAKQMAANSARQLAVASLADQPELEVESLLRAAGMLWSAGVAVDFRALNAIGVRHHVSLPTYPFERQRHWIEPSSAAATAPSADAAARPQPSTVLDGVAPAPAGGSLAWLLDEQMQVMEAQLALLETSRKS